MARTSKVHYIAPSAISITPNANNSSRDLAVYVARGARIKVRSEGIKELDFVEGTFQEWTFSGRNRRLSNATAPYTIYIRLPKNKADGYLVFAQKDDHDGTFADKYCYVLENGLSPFGQDAVTGEWGASVKDDLNWWIKIGEVSAPDESGQRTVSIDTGILGSDQYNSEWDQAPEDMPLRIELSCSIDGEPAGQTPYLRWGKGMTVQATLVEGWQTNAGERVKYWTIARDTGSAEADEAWSHPAAVDEETGEEKEGETTDRRMEKGRCVLWHVLGGTDDFDAAVAATFTITAWGVKEEGEDDRQSADGGGTSSVDAGGTEPQEEGGDAGGDAGEEDGPAMVPLAVTSITVFAETVSDHELVLSSDTVTYNPVTQVYSPAGGVEVRIRARAQDGSLMYLTDDNITEAAMKVLYLPVGEEDDGTPHELTFTNGRGFLSTTLFQDGKSLSLWLEDGTQKVLARKTVTYIRYGEKGDTPVSIYRWYKDGLLPLKPTSTDTEEPAPADGDADGAENVYPVDRWSKTVPGRPATGEWVLWKCYSVKHGSGVIDAWEGPVQESGTKGTPGEDASDREYIYRRLQSYPFSGKVPADITVGEVAPTGVADGTETDSSLDDWVPNGWSDRAMPVTADEMFVYMSVREKPAGNNQQWWSFQQPVIWSHWGRNGVDGDGVEYVFVRTNSSVAPTIVDSGAAYEDSNGNKYTDDEFLPLATGSDLAGNVECTDDPVGTDASHKFEWCAKRTMSAPDINGVRAWERYSGVMSRWGVYAESITKQSEASTYQVADDGVTTPSGTWHATKQAAVNTYNQSHGIDGTGWEKDTWIWTKTVITWSDASSTTLYATELNPNDGHPGQDIIADDTVMKYQCTDTNTVHPDEDDPGWGDLADITLEQGLWLWSKATTYYRKSGSAPGSRDAGRSVNYNVSYIAEDGAEGRGITGSTEHYKASALDGRDAQHSESKPVDDGVENDSVEWNTDPNLAGDPVQWDEDHPYLWNYERTTYSSGETPRRTTPHIVAIWTKDGVNGKGIDSVVNYYKVSDLGTGVTSGAVNGRDWTPPAGSGWEDNPVAPSPDQPYLWNFEKITWINGDNTRTYTYTTPHVIGHYGKDGDIIRNVEIFRASDETPDLPTSRVIPPIGWSETMPQGGHPHADSSISQWSDSTDAAFPASEGWRQANGNNVDGALIRERVHFTPDSDDFTLYIEIAASAEMNYDFVYVGNLSQEVSSRPSSPESLRTTKSKSDKEIVTVGVGALGHSGEDLFVDIIFTKDGSQSNGQDCGWYRVVEAQTIWKCWGVAVNGVLDSNGWQGPVRVNGDRGKDGKDGYTILANPSTLILNQENATDSSTSFGLPKAITFSAKSGNNTVAVSSVSASSIDIAVTVSGTTISVDSVKTRDNKYVTTGTIKAVVTLEDGASFNVDIPFYINLFGTFKREIEQGVETAVGEVTEYLKDGNGNIIRSEYLYEEVNSAQQSITTIQATMNNTKNLLTGVLTGDGWLSVDGNIESEASVNSSGGIYHTGQELMSPTFATAAGETYTFSFWWNSSVSASRRKVTVWGVDPGDEQELSLTPTSNYSEGRRRYTCTFVAVDTAASVSIEYANVNYPIYKPQVEVGSSVTEFEASSSETASRINQRADAIELSVTNKLGETGIKINGNTREIDLIAGKVKFKNSSGTADSGKISIEADGTLHAVDGIFEGTVKATTLYSSFAQKALIYNVDSSVYNIVNDLGYLPNVLYIATTSLYTQLSSFTVILPSASSYEGHVVDMYGQNPMYSSYDYTGISINDVFLPLSDQETIVGANRTIYSGGAQAWHIRILSDGSRWRLLDYSNVNLSSA